jgi:hypothetical protein
MTGQRDTSAVPLNCGNLGRRFGRPACVVLAAVNLNATAIFSSPPLFLFYSLSYYGARFPKALVRVLIFERFKYILSKET